MLSRLVGSAFASGAVLRTGVLAPGLSSCPAPPSSNAAMSSGGGWLLIGFGAVVNDFLLDMRKQFFR